MSEKERNGTGEPRSVETSRDVRAILGDDRWLPPHPLHVVSKIIAFFTSLTLYSGLVMLIYFVGCHGFSAMDNEGPVAVDFFEKVPRTLEEEKKGGDEPEKAPEPVEEVLPPRPVPETPVTVVNTDQDKLVSAAPTVDTRHLIAMGTPGDQGTGIIGRRDEGGREDGMARHGGSPAAENAVKAALRWLAVHQDADGKWDARDYTQHCPPDDTCWGRSPVQHSGLPGTYDVGITGLALMSFLGHGNTHREGEHREVVKRGLDWLLSQQNERTGAFSAGERTSMYNQGIATLILAETFAMSKDESLRERLVRAVGFLCQAQQAGGGWDYTEVRTNRNDTSVTGWEVMALKSAHSAGVDIPWKTTYGILRHFERVTDEQGNVGYVSDRATREGIALTSVGMLSNLYMGLGTSHPTVERQCRILIENLPAWHKLSGSGGRDHSMYYWYYGTLAMYQKGGTEWDRWNSAIRDMLVRAQCTRGHRSGSWDPDGHWAKSFAGRVYSTALMTLTLEIYYRYLPMYESGPTLGGGSALVKLLEEEPNPTKKIAILRKLVAFKDPAVPEVLEKLLEDENPAVRFAAAKHLAERGDARAVPFLANGLKHPDQFYRFNAIRALEDLEDPGTVGPLVDALDDELDTNANLAARALQRKTGVKFGLPETRDPVERRKIIASWKSWWENNRERLSAVPDVQGTVVAARGGGLQVLVKVEPEDTLAEGMMMKVYRSGKPVGHVRVVKVLRGGMAEGTVTHWELVGSSVRSGDLVATKQAPEEKPE